MRTRHRIPSIFNLSMVDVLCCALGCVILLWLLNLREARDRAEKVGQTSDILKKTEAELAGTQRQRDERQRKLEEAASVLAALEKTLKSLQAQKADAEDRLEKLSRDQQA